MLPRWAGAVLAALLLCASVPLPVSAQAAPDVVVIGGTPAGVAAAVAAARRGENVVLVARRSVLGGVLTDAMMDQWDLNMTPRGTASVEGGIFREIYAALGDSFTPAEAARAFGALVGVEPRIRVITNAQAVAVTTLPDDADRRVASVTIDDLRDHHETVLGARSIIDATDDGDVAALAGARYDIGRQDTGRDTLMQPVTLMFTLTGVDWRAVERSYRAARFGPGGATDRRAWGYGSLMQQYWPLSADVVVRDLNFGHEDGGSVTVNAIDVLGIDGRIAGDLDRARTIAQIESPHLVAFLQTHLPGFAHARIGRYADSIYVRETRHFFGIERLTADDIWGGKVPEDTIGLSSYPLDLHPVTIGDRPAFAPVRHVYGVPLGTLIPRGFTNLILAGPAISASHIASGSVRVIPTTIEEGEAAGAAAAQAEAHHITLAALATSMPEIAELRDDLRAHGAIFATSPSADIALGSHERGAP